MARLATLAERKQQSEGDQSVSAHIPLSEAGLCVKLKCGAVFNATHHETCPACGSSHVVLLASCIGPLQGVTDEAGSSGN